MKAILNLLVGGIWGLTVGLIMQSLHVEHYHKLPQYWILLIFPIIGYTTAIMKE